MWVVLALIALPGLGWWLLGDVLVVAVANRRLPHHIDQHLVIRRAFADPPATAAVVVVELTPTRARALARAAADQAIPPTVLRAGMTVEAGWSGLAGSDPLALRVQLGASEPPVARAVLSAALVNDLIERHHRREQAGSSVTYDYRLDPGSVVVDDGVPVAIDGGWRRRFRATASGEVEAAFGGDRCLVRVSYVEATIDLDLLRGDTGWRLRGDVAVGRCESTIITCTSTLLRLAAGGLPQVLEGLLDQSLAEENLEKVRLPEWFPCDIRLDGRLE